jgi:hypothetical protein
LQGGREYAWKPVGPLPIPLPPIFVDSKGMFDGIYSIACDLGGKMFVEVNGFDEYPLSPCYSFPSEAQDSLSVSPSVVSLDSCNQVEAQATVTVNYATVIPSPVTLSASNLPPGVTASFNPNPTSSQSTLTLWISGVVVDVTVPGIFIQQQSYPVTIQDSRGKNTTLTVDYHNCGLVDDRNITLDTAAKIDQKRQELRTLIWGTQGFPSTKQPTTTRQSVCSMHTPPATDVCNFASSLANLKRIDELEMVMETNVNVFAYHFVANQANGKLVIVNPGHECTLNNLFDPNQDSGYQVREAITALLKDGYSVLGVYMPAYSPNGSGNSCDILDHYDFVNRSVSQGIGLKFFLEPTAVSLNYLETQWSAHNFPKYSEFDMVGLSGGG